MTGVKLRHAHIALICSAIALCGVLLSYGWRQHQLPLTLVGGLGALALLAYLRRFLRKAPR